MKKLFYLILLYSISANLFAASNWQSCHYSSKKEFHCHNGIDNYQKKIDKTNINNNTNKENDLENNNIVEDSFYKDYEYYIKELEKLSDKTKEEFNKTNNGFLVINAYKQSEVLYLKACQQKEKADLFKLKQPIIKNILKYKEKHAYKIPLDFIKIIKKHCN